MVTSSVVVPRGFAVVVSCVVVVGTAVDVVSTVGFEVTIVVSWLFVVGRDVVVSGTAVVEVVVGPVVTIFGGFVVDTL